MAAPKLPPDILRAIQEAADYVARRVVDWQRPGAKIRLFHEDTPLSKAVKDAIRQGEEDRAWQQGRQFWEIPSNRPVGDSPAHGELAARDMDAIVNKRLGINPDEEYQVVQQEARRTGRGLYKKFGNIFRSKLVREPSEAYHSPGTTPVEPEDLAQEIITQLMREIEARPQSRISKVEDKLNYTIPRFVSMAVDNVALPRRHVEIARAVRDLGKYRGMEPTDPRVPKLLAKAQRLRLKGGTGPEGHDIEPLQEGTASMSRGPDQVLQAQRLEQLQTTLQDLLAGDTLTPRQKTILDHRFGLTQDPVRPEDTMKMLNIARRTLFYDQRKALEALHEKLGPMAERFGIEFEAPTKRDPFNEIKSLMDKLKEPERQGPPVLGAKSPTTQEDIDIIRQRQKYGQQLAKLSEPTEGEITRMFRRDKPPSRTPSKDEPAPTRGTPENLEDPRTPTAYYDQGPEFIGPPQPEALEWKRIFKPAPGAKRTVTEYAPAQDIRIVPGREEGGLPITVRAEGPPRLIQDATTGELVERPPQVPGRLTWGLSSRTEPRVEPGPMRQVRYQEQVPITTETKGRAPRQATKPRTTSEESTERVFKVDPATGERMEIVRHKNTDPATRRQRRYNWFRVTRVTGPDGKEIIVESPL